MKDVIKKTMLMGLGVANITKDKLKKMTDELVELGKMSEEEGENLYNELHEESKKAKKDLEDRVDDLVKASMSKLPCCRLWEEINGRIANIEKALNIETTESDEGGCCKKDEKE